MNCEWVTDPSGIVIQGYKIKRGFFYLGEAFPVYNKKRLLGDIGRKTNVHFLKEPVIHLASANPIINEGTGVDNEWLIQFVLASITTSS